MAEINFEQQIKELFSELKSKGNLPLEQLYSEKYLKSLIILINKYINIYINLKSIKSSRILKYIIFLRNKFSSQSFPANYNYKTKNKNNIKKLILLIYLMIYLNQILIKNNPNIEQSKKYLYFKKLYSLLKLVSSITSKLYLDKIIDITDLEIILKILIIFTVNDNYKDIKENSDIKNFMYFKECLNILVISFNKKVFTIS